MSNLSALFLTFFKIGAFSFGGGYAMLPLIEREIVVNHKWLTPTEFIDIIGISNATPGPIAINSATFVGYKIAGVAGSLVASLAVVLFSFFLVIIASHFIRKFKNSVILKSILLGLRPALIALILSAVYSSANKIYYNFETKVFDFKAMIISIITMILLLKTKIHPILIILFSAVLGFIFYGLLTFI